MNGGLKQFQRQNLLIKTKEKKKPDRILIECKTHKIMDTPAFVGEYNRVKQLLHFKMSLITYSTFAEYNYNYSCSEKVKKKLCFFTNKKCTL